MADSRKTQAFPRNANEERAGMTMLDYYAGQALVGLLASNLKLTGTIEEVDCQYAARAYQMAEKMCTARDMIEEDKAKKAAELFRKIL